MLDNKLSKLIIIVGENFNDAVPWSIRKYLGVIMCK